jgi:hypothetical protein
MRMLLFLSVLLASCLLRAQESTSVHHDDPQADKDKVDRLCGRLVESDGVSKGTGEEKTRSLARISVELFKAGDASQCCDGLSKVASARTGLTGEFQFKADLTPGSYWLAFHPGGHNFTILVQYEATAKQVTKKCSELLYILEGSGDVHLLRKNGSD